MQNTVSYIGTTMVLDKVRQVRELAALAMEVKTIFFGNLPEFSNYKKLLCFLQRQFSITGIDPMFAHLVFPANWGYATGTFDDVAKTRKMTCPLALAIMGKLLSVPLGESVSGIEKSLVRGIDGISMDLSFVTLRRARLKLNSLGVNLILHDGKVIGQTTANKSNNINLHTYPTMDWINAIEKSIMKISNEIACKNQGLAHVKDLKEAIEEFFLGLTKKNLIQNPIPKVFTGFNDQGKRTVTIILQKNNYYQLATPFEIILTWNSNVRCYEMTSVHHVVLVD